MIRLNPSALILPLSLQMPTYVYECDGCRQVFEVWQRMVDDPVTECPKDCGGSVKRIIQPLLALTGVGGASAPDRPRFT